MIKSRNGHCTRLYSSKHYIIYKINLPRRGEVLRCLFYVENQRVTESQYVCQFFSNQKTFDSVSVQTTNPSTAWATRLSGGGYRQQYDVLTPRKASVTDRADMPHTAPAPMSLSAGSSTVLWHMSHRAHVSSALNRATSMYPVTQFRLGSHRHCCDRKPGNPSTRHTAAASSPASRQYSRPRRDIRQKHSMQLAVPDTTSTMAADHRVQTGSDWTGVRTGGVCDHEGLLGDSGAFSST